MSKNFIDEPNFDIEFDDDIMKQIIRTKNLNELKKGDKLIITSFYEEKFGYKLKDNKNNYYYSNSQCTKFLNNIIDYNNDRNDKLLIKEEATPNKYKLNKELFIIVQDKKEFNNNEYSVLEFHFMKAKQ